MRPVPCTLLTLLLSSLLGVASAQAGAAPKSDAPSGSSVNSQLPIEHPQPIGGQPTDASAERARRDAASGADSRRDDQPPGPGNGSSSPSPGSPVPEPRTLLLVGTGLLGIGVLTQARRRRRRAVSA